jgi:hypothetical protein
MAGQVAYHLLAQAGVIRAPWEATTLVSCLPVLVLGMGSALAHMLRSDATAAGAPVQFTRNAESSVGLKVPQVELTVLSVIRPGIPVGSFTHERMADSGPSASTTPVRWQCGRW